MKVFFGLVFVIQEKNSKFALSIEKVVTYLN